MDLRKLKKLIDLVQESGIGEIEITEGEEKVRICRQAPGGPPVIMAAPRSAVEGAAPRPARPDEDRERPRAAAAVLGGQERDQYDGDAGLFAHRSRRQGNLVDRRFPQEAADRLTRELQDLDGPASRQSARVAGATVPPRMPIVCARQVMNVGAS